MKNKILLHMLVVASTMGQVRAQNAESPIGTERDSEVYQATFYFPVRRWGLDSAERLHEDVSPTSLGEVQRHDLACKGIASERISFEGQGIDNETSSDNKARRADVRGVIRLAMVAEPTHTKSISKSKLRWYAGIEGGVSLGVSTLSSFTPKGGAGWNVGLMGGYRIFPLLSAEVGISFGSLKLGSSKCCEDYFLGADGVRYLTSVAGMDSYSYRDIYSSVSMQQYALRLNVDMLQLVKPDWNKRWSLTLSPAIYGIGTQATLKTANTTIIKRESRFQFGVGIGIGGSYQITKNLGVGLRSGAVWVFGKRYDGIVPTDHKENMIWNNTLTLTWRFGCKK